MLSRRAMQYVPMRSLAGHPSPRKSQRPPRLIAIGTSPEDMSLLDRFGDKLYPMTMPDFKAGGRLRQLVREAINVPYSSAEEELATVVAENNRLVSDLRKEIADLKALAATNARTIGQLETQLQQSNARALNAISAPSVASGGVDSAVAGASRSTGGTIRRREPSLPRSPDRNVRQRTAGGSGILGTAISAIAGSPVAIARRMVGGVPPLRTALRPPPLPTAEQLSTVSTGNNSAGGKKEE